VKAYELQISLRRNSEVTNRNNVEPGPAGMDLVWLTKCLGGLGLDRRV
jgi:hypothetical protein